jgi:hypothetical protein
MADIDTLKKALETINVSKRQNALLDWFTRWSPTVRLKQIGLIQANRGDPEMLPMG